MKELPKFDPTILVEEQRGKTFPKETGFDILARGFKANWRDGDLLGLRRFFGDATPTITVPRFRGPDYQVTLPRALPRLPMPVSKAELDRAYKP